MFYEVYIDIFFAVNTMLDFYIILLVKMIQHYKTTKLRILMASMTGSAILCLFLCIPVKKNMAWQVFFYAMSYTGMAAIAFPDQKRLGRMKSIVTLYVVSIFVNGCFQWLHVRFNHFTTLLAACTMLYLCIRTICILYRIRTKQHIYDVCLLYRKQTIHMKGLWDTGNRLRSPYHQRGISVIEYACLKDYISESVKKYIETERYEQDWETEGEKIFLIPYQTVGQTHAMMPVIMADMMWIQREEDTLEYRRPLLGISTLPLGSDHAFQMIITTDG